jgi:hypothetical protein
MLFTFEQQIRDCLFPTLKLMGGEFDLMAYVNTTGEILVDLHFRDSPRDIAIGDGFYETNARLGGIINPLIGTANHINTNALQLQGLLDNLISAKGQFDPIEINTAGMSIAGVSLNGQQFKAPNSPPVNSFQPQSNYFM